MKEYLSHHDTAFKIIEIYDNNPSKADEILSEQFFITLNKRPFQTICQFIFLTVLRNKFLIERTIELLSAKKPRKKLYCVLKTAHAEILITETKQHPKVIHSWVEYTKKAFSIGESKFVNALLRKSFEKMQELKNSSDLSVAYSMPNWLVQRWISTFGKEQTIEILKICNLPSEVFFRQSPTDDAKKIFESVSKYFKNSDFENFYILKSGNWQNVKHLINTKHFYIQDPSTSFAVDKFKPECSKKYLDLCASPGGKSRIIADFILKNSSNNRDKLQETLLVSIDVKDRIQKLKQNLSHINFITSKVIECDLLKENLDEKLIKENLPIEFDGVFIDAPCSNTGVLRRRPDARYRINENDINQCKKIQAELLQKYSNFVKTSGILVFSTCSIDKVENEDNIELFLKNNPNFEILYSHTYLPTLQSDGCGCFIMRKK